MILMDHNGHVRELGHGRLHEGPQKWRPGIFPGAGTGLHDDGGVGLVGRLHNGAGLLKVVHVEGRHAISKLCCVIQ